jgi:hypothetical protein
MFAKNQIPPKEEKRGLLKERYNMSTPFSNMAISTSSVFLRALREEQPVIDLFLSLLPLIW